MDSTPIELTKTDLIYIALIGAGIGLVLGLIPLILAIRKGKLKLGLLAAALSTIGGALSVIISVIVVAIFIWLILRKSANRADTDSSVSSDSNPS